MSLLLIFADKTIKWSDDKPTLSDLMAVKQNLLTILRITTPRQIHRLVILDNGEVKWEEVEYAELKFEYNFGFCH